MGLALVRVGRAKYWHTVRYKDGLRITNLEIDPIPVIMAHGIGGVAYHQHWITDMPGIQKVPLDPDKPPYIVPPMTQVENMPDNGLRVASTFSGAGGTCIGFRMAGFRSIWASEFVDAAREVYELNHPGVPVDARDIRDVTAQDILDATGLSVGELDVLEGSPPCFVAGTPVPTLRGVLPIECVEPDDRVLTHKGRWRRVVSTSRRRADTITVCGRIGVTPDHLFFCRAPDEAPNEAWWTPAAKVAGSFCATPIKFPSCDIPPPPAGLIHNQAFWRDIGLWLGDDRLGDVTSSALIEWLHEWFDQGVQDRTMPGWVFGAPPELRAALHNGFIESSSVGDDVGHTLTVRGRCMAAAVALLCESLGWNACMRGPVDVPDEAGHGPEFNIRCTPAANPDDPGFDGLRWSVMDPGNLPGGRDVVVHDLEVEEDHSFVADVFVVHNCAGFSTAGKRERSWGKICDYSETEQRVDDLFFEFARLVKGIQPRMFMGENVSGLVKGRAKGYFKLILQDLKDCGYHVRAKVLDAQWLGVPQSRKRLIFLGVRDDLGVESTYPTPMLMRYSVREALDFLPGQRLIHDTRGDPKFSQGDVTDRPAPTIVQGGGAVSLHYTVRTKSLSYPPSEEEIEAADMSRYRAGKLWEQLRPGQSAAQLGEHLRGGSTKGVHGALRRDAWNKPSYTVMQTGGHAGSASVTHPEECRKLYVWEIKRLCGFPDDFYLTGTYKQQWERMGRAVPPVMAFWIAREIRNLLLGIDGDDPWEHDPMQLMDPRMYVP